MQQFAGGGTSGALRGATFTGPEQTTLLTTLQAITNGSFAITISGTLRQIGPVNFSGAASLVACGTLINTAMSPFATFAFTANAFAATNAGSGAGATMSYASAPSSGTDISATLRLTSGTGATITQPAASQWLPCNGRYVYGYAPVTARPHTAPSTGTTRDYWRNVGSFAGSRGIGGFMMRAPYDPGATWSISTADDNVEATLTNPPTPQRPPPGVK